MYKNLLWSAFVLSTAFLLGCSSDETCSCNEPSSSSVKPSSSSSGGGTAVQNVDLVRKNITLSSNKSYASIDGEPIAYTENDAASRLDKIDLVAYCNVNMGCKNNSIYNPFVIKLFLDTAGYIGKNIYLYEVPAEDAGIFKTAKKLYDILDTYNGLMAAFEKSEDADEIPIEEGKVFFVITLENGYGVVIGIAIIKQAGGQSVDLEIIERPIPNH